MDELVLVELVRLREAIDLQTGVLASLLTGLLSDDEELREQAAGQAAEFVLHYGLRKGRRG